ncbi:MAG: 50S ribosomal protein L17 [Chloroflexi bacterium]|nr:50S ribosomal protein L17 [Chloroflexota bacterium]
MRHQVSGRHLGRNTAQRLALYRNLVTDLLRYEKITTTEAKAKEIQGMAEKMITLGKEGSLRSRRLALRFLMDEAVADKLFSELNKRYATRAGGYTRITRLGPRLGDNAPMVQLEVLQ